MPLGYKYYRDSWIKVTILTVGVGAMLWSTARGETKGTPQDPWVLVFVVGLTMAAHIGLLLLMSRAKRREAALREPPAIQPLRAGPEATPPRLGVMQRELSHRGIGVVFLVCGLGLAALAVGWPVWDALHQKPGRLHLVATVVTPFAIVLGLLYAVWPARMVAFLGPLQQPSVRAWMLYLPLLLAGLALYAWLRHFVGHHAAP